jgi:hypothetical protein
VSHTNLIASVELGAVNVLLLGNHLSYEDSFLIYPLAHILDSAASVSGKESKGAESGGSDAEQEIEDSSEWVLQQSGLFDKGLGLILKKERPCSKPPRAIAAWSVLTHCRRSVL